MLLKYIALNCILFFVFHVTLNSCNTKLKNDGVHWGSLDIQIILHVGFKAMYFVFSKNLRFMVKLINCDLMHTTSPDLSRTFPVMKQRPFTAIAVLSSSIKHILHNLFYWCFKLWFCYQPISRVRWGSPRH